MKRIIIAALLVTVLLASFGTTYAKWGYAKEKLLRNAARIFVNGLQVEGINAQFRLYEDGSWAIVGCLPDGLCQD
jgi:hypothetical protein